MRQTVEAVYEGGILRPLQVLHLREGGHVRISVEEEPAQSSGAPGSNVKKKPVLSDLAGTMKDSPLFQNDPVSIQKALRDEWS